VARGKGGKERVLWLAPTALPAVRDWLAVRGDQPGPLLNPVLKGGRRQERRLSAQAVYDLCLKLVKSAAILAATPHDWRRTWTGNLLEVTDLSTAQKLAGHARPDTTAAYDRRPETTRRRAAAMLHVPYVLPRARLIRILCLARRGRRGQALVEWGRPSGRRPEREPRLHPLHPIPQDRVAGARPSATSRRACGPQASAGIWAASQFRDRRLRVP